MSLIVARFFYGSNLVSVLHMLGLTSVVWNNRSGYSMYFFKLVVERVYGERYHIVAQRRVVVDI